MKISFLLVSLFLFCGTVKSQEIIVSGQCITGSITLTQIADEAGKPAYAGTGTVLGFPDIDVTIFWIGAPDNVWVLAFDGQPFYLQSCDTPEPPPTTSTVCTWEEALPGECTGTNPLSITGSGTLPVNLVSFSAKETRTGQVALSWQTASESNNKGFEIQRSANSNNWSAIGFVPGAGNAVTVNNYTFTDAQPFSGKSFYRLMQVDFDGKKSYSSIEAIDIINTNSFYTIYGNPGKGNFNVQFSSPKNVEFIVHDINGKKLLTKKAGSGIEQIDLSAYPAGIYLLSIHISGKIFTEKLVKQ